FAMTTLERKRVEKFRRKGKDARIYARLSALLWLADGRPAAEVAALLDVCPRTVNDLATAQPPRREGEQASSAEGHQARGVRRVEAVVASSRREGGAPGGSSRPLCPGSTASQGAVAEKPICRFHRPGVTSASPCRPSPPPRSASPAPRP